MAVPSDLRDTLRAQARHKEEPFARQTLLHTAWSKVEKTPASVSIKTVEITYLLTLFEVDYENDIEYIICETVSKRDTNSWSE